MFNLWGPRPKLGNGFLILEIYSSQQDASESVGLPWPSDQLVTDTFHLTTHGTHNSRISMAPAGFEPAIPSNKRLADPCLRPSGHRHSAVYSTHHYKILHFLRVLN